MTYVVAAWVFLLLNSDRALSPRAGEITSDIVTPASAEMAAFIAGAQSPLGCDQALSLRVNARTSAIAAPASAGMAAFITGLKAPWAATGL
jgi:hypothetical protein